MDAVLALGADCVITPLPHVHAHDQVAQILTKTEAKQLVEHLKTHQPEFTQCSLVLPGYDGGASEEQVANLLLEAEEGSSRKDRPALAA